MKTHAETLTQWVSDKIEFGFGTSRILFTRDALEKVVHAINRRDTECTVWIRGVQHLYTNASWAQLLGALLLRNEVLTTAFLCRFDSFLEAAFAINPPDTLAYVNKQANGWYGHPTSALAAECQKIG